MYIVFLIVVGLLSGVTASMGLGGGFILLICFSIFTSFPQLQNQLLNLIFFIPISILSLILHYKNNLIEKKVLLKAILFGLLGALIGTVTSTFINDKIIKKLFGALIIFVGLKQLIDSKKTNKSSNK